MNLITDKIKTKYQFLGQNLLKTSIRKIFLTLRYHLLQRKKKQKSKNKGFKKIIVIIRPIFLFRLKMQ